MKNKVAIITGASRGLGRSLASQLSKQGFIIYAGYRSTEIDSSSENIIPIYIDYLDEKSLETAIDRVIGAQGQIDLLINNGAIAYYGAADSLTIEEARNLYEINVIGPFRLTQLALPYLRAQKSGHIIFISSIRAVESCVYMGMYSGSKAALEAIAFDWAASLIKWNIKVQVVEPGPIATNIDIRHGTYFRENENPYLPYGDDNIIWQSVEEATKQIVNAIMDNNPHFRIQTSLSSQKIISNHLKDETGILWLTQQRAWVMNKKTNSPINKT